MLSHSTNLHGLHRAEFTSILIESKCLRQPSAPGPRMTLILRRVAARVLAILRRVAARVLAYNAYWGASTKNRSKANRKSLRNRPQNGPKSVPNRSQIGPKSVQDRLRNRPRCQLRFWTVLEPFSDCLGPLLAASWRLPGGQVGIKLVQK